jgi:hypothetical protein
MRVFVRAREQMHAGRLADADRMAVIMTKGKLLTLCMGSDKCYSCLGNAMLIMLHKQL